MTFRQQITSGRLTRRLTQLFVGLSLFGLSNALLVRSRLGLDPWNVLHQGLARHVPLTIGGIIIIVGALVMLTWIPLRQSPGIGTIANTLWIGIATDASLAVVPEFHGLATRALVACAGITLCGISSALYIGSQLSPGPRDGLMTMIAQHSPLSLRTARIAVETTVLAAGWLLGGTVGVATVLFALAIGPLVQFFLPWVIVRVTVPEHPRPKNTTDTPHTEQPPHQPPADA